MLNYSIENKVAVLQMDDGKANALSYAMLDALEEALSRAEKEARAVVLVGRSGVFCAGFDLKIMMKDADSARALVRRGAEANIRLLLHPQPVVAACTGHALAAGTLLLLASDCRIGAKGDFKIGLNEVTIGMRLPIFAARLAADRLSAHHVVPATVGARIYDPEAACEAGYLDRVVDADQILEESVREACAWPTNAGGALAATKRVLHGPLVDYVRATLDDDLADLG